nr:MAG TPA: hypothetical protein [Caudoviricetes sp.]
MENSLTKLENLAKFIFYIHKYARDYYGLSVADIAHPRHRYLDARVTETALRLNNTFQRVKDSLDIISFNQIYTVLNYVDSTDLIKIICGQKETYKQHFKRLLAEYLMVQMYDTNFMVDKLKDLVLKYIEEDTNNSILKDFNSKGNGFRVVDNDDIFFKVLKQGRFKNHSLRKQLESLTAEYKEPGIAIPIFADENNVSIVSGTTLRVYIIDAEPRVDISAIDDSTLTSLVQNRTQETCEYYILYPIFHKKKDKVADENDECEVINNINSLVGFRMMVNRSHSDKVRSLRDANGIYYPLYDIINLKGNVVIDKIPVPEDPFIVKTPEVPLENIKETKMKVATFELNDTFKMLEYLHTHDAEKKHPVSKRIQDMTGEYARPIPVIRNLTNDDLADILVITNNEPEGYVSDIICREDTYYVTVSAYPGTKLEEMVEKYQKGETSLLKFHPNYIADEDVPDEIDEESANIIRSLHCFDYREATPAKVLKFKK